MRAVASDILGRNHVSIVGRGTNTVIFAHGFGTDQRIWNAQVAAFARDYRCVLFDHVGAGKSDLSIFSPRRYSSLYSYASDLVEVCRALDIKEAAVVGHSVSGMVALLASLLSKDLFRSIATIGASPRYLNDASAGYRGGFEQSDIDSLIVAMNENYYTWASGYAPLAMANLDRPQLSEQFAQTLLEIRPDIAQAVLRTILYSDHRAELTRVDVPVHVLQSENDVAVPAEVGEFLAASLPTGRLIKLRSTGHLPHLSAPEAVNEVLAEFLTQ